MIDPTFINIIRQHLKYLAPEAALDPDAELRSLGLDSMAAVNLMLDLEDEFEVLLPDSHLIAEAFRTTRSLWSAFSANGPEAFSNLRLSRGGG